MLQLPDAPYIVEAERLGMPPYSDSDFEEKAQEQGKKILKADELIDDIVDIIIDAEDAVLKFKDTADEALEMANELRQLMYKVESIGCDIRRMGERLEGR